MPRRRNCSGANSANDRDRSVGTRPRPLLSTGNRGGPALHSAPSFPLHGRGCRRVRSAGSGPDPPARVDTLLLRGTASDRRVGGPERSSVSGELGRPLAQRRIEVGGRHPPVGNGGAGAVRVRGADEAAGDGSSCVVLGALSVPRRDMAGLHRPPVLDPVDSILCVLRCRRPGMDRRAVALPGPGCHPAGGGGGRSVHLICVGARQQLVRPLSTSRRAGGRRHFRLHPHPDTSIRDPPGG